MNSVIRCSLSAIDESLSHLRAGGVMKCETVVLWLGIVHDGIAEVREVYRPKQNVDIDIFQIPKQSMRELMARIKETRFQILAQVHSHPERAFHSKADDTWAIIRHVGAVSIVIPYFAKDTIGTNFGDRAATFQLNASNNWVEVDFKKVVEVV